MITIEMPYLANLSENRYRCRNGRLRSDVKRWVVALQLQLYVAEISAEVPGDYARIGIEVIAPAGPGRLPDTENFRKPIHDAIGVALDCDDQRFVGWEAQSPPARKAMKGERAAIIVRIVVVLGRMKEKT